MVDYYLKKGYTLEWIESRIKSIINRKKLTSTWKESGIDKESEYAMLNKAWSGMTAQDYKTFKRIRKESLRDNMTDIEVILTDLGEITTRELAKKYKPKGFDQNKKIAKVGGSIASNNRKDIEKNLGESVISDKNYLGYQYDDIKKINE